jgi:uncharacterized protein (TIGR02271 family)
MPQIAKPVDKGWNAESQLQQMLAYNVEDTRGNRIGHVSGLWVDANNEVEFVGVRTTWLMGRTHIFPAQGMQVNHGRDLIRAPYPEDVVKNAPSFDPGSELVASEQQEIFNYYKGFGLRRGEAQTQARGQQQQQAGRNREQANIELTEEQLKVGKRQVEAGGVRLRKVVRTETVNQPVELQREELVVERVPGQGRAAGDKKFEQEDIYIPLRREEAVVEKDAVVREQVRVQKTAHTDRQQVSEQVRKEDVEIEESGDASRLHTGDAKAANRLREQEAKPRSQRRQGS